MKLQELNQNEQKTITGGSLLGGDDSILSIVTEGYISISQTDDDGDTSNTTLSYGSGSIFQNESD